MEGDENVDVSGSCGGAPASSRWNPTKEQISMLENLYRQGIRTPSAEQIQQITSRLKAYGHIEGKNVFYWFQNHKARQRQRQKQKQENMAYYTTRYLHKTSTSSPHVFPPCPTVVCSPYYIPQNNLGFYQHYPKVLVPGGIKRRPCPEKMEKLNPCVGVGNDQYDVVIHSGNNNCNSTSTTNQETLALFPLQPTGILQASSSLVSTSAENSTTTTTTTSSSCETTGIEERSGYQPFFDFFSGNGSYESD